MENKIVANVGSWNIEKDGSMTHETPYYDIDGASLSTGNWLTHMACKRWVDMREFTHAFFTACRVRGIQNVTLRADITF